MNTIGNAPPRRPSTPFRIAKAASAPSQAPCGDFSGTLNVSQLYPALSCFFLFFNRFHSKGPSMPDSKKKPRTNRGFLNISLQQQQNTIWTLPWR